MKGGENKADGLTGRENKKSKPVSDRFSPALETLIAIQEPDFAGSQRERKGKMQKRSGFVI